MPIVNVENVGAIGIIKGNPPHELPPEAWSDGVNVRMIDQSVQRSPGIEPVFDPPRVQPHLLQPVAAPGSFFWAYAGLQQVWVTDMNSHADITRVSATYQAPIGSWNGGVLGGILILNNGFDIPQMWSANPSLGVKLQDLSNWQSTVRAVILRPFKQYLVALNITKSGVAFPHMVKWSHPADPGAVPISWNEADATKDAGEFPVAEAGGPLIDCLPLRDANILYKEDVTFLMYPSGPPKIFGFRKLFGDTGMLAPRCVQDIGGRHCVVARGDIIVHDGQSKESILSAKQRSSLFNTVGGNSFFTAFTAAIPDKHEFWFCYPKGNDVFCTEAFIWNWKDKTHTYKDLHSITDMKTGVVDPGLITSWDAISRSWEEANDSWDSQAGRPTQVQAVQASPANGRLNWLDRGLSEEGTAIRAFVERLGIGLTGTDRHGNPKVDITKWKYCKRVWLKMRSTGVVYVTVGAQEAPDGTVRWGERTPFTPGVQDYVECDAHGRLLALRIESDDIKDWAIDGYAMDIEITSEF